MPQKILFLLAVLFRNARQSHATHFIGKLESKTEFTVLANFCFGATTKEPVYHLKSPLNAQRRPAGLVEGEIYVQRDALFLLYDDEDDSYPAIYRDVQVDCSFAVTPTYGQEDPKTGKHGPARYVQALNGGQKNEIRVNLDEHIRPRFWTAAIAHCYDRSAVVSQPRLQIFSKLQQGNRRLSSVLRSFHPVGYKFRRYNQNKWKRHHNLLDDRLLPPSQQVGRIEVKLHMQNKALSLGGWELEFSEDELLLLPCNLFFLALYLVLAIYMWRSIALSTQSHDQTSTTTVSKLLFGIVGIQLASILFSCIELVKFTMDGIVYINSLPMFRILASMCDHVLKICFLVLLTLLANGFEITHHGIQHKSRLAKLSMVLLLLYLLSSTWMLVASVTYDPNYIDEYHNLFSIVVTALELWLLLSTFANLVQNILDNVTYSNNKLTASNQRLYAFFAVFAVYVEMLILIPLMQLLSFMVDPWVRASVITTLAFTSQAFGLVVLGYTFRPSNVQVIKREVLQDKYVKEQHSELKRHQYNLNELEENDAEQVASLLQ